MSPEVKANFSVIFVTCKDKREAKAILNELLANKLVACGNIIEGLESIFVWKGKIERQREALLILKAKTSHFRALEKLVKQRHSYEVPEIICLPISKGNRKYLMWLDGVTKK